MSTYPSPAPRRLETALIQHLRPELGREVFDTLVTRLGETLAEVARFDFQ